MQAADSDKKWACPRSIDLGQALHVMRFGIINALPLHPLYAGVLSAPYPESQRYDLYTVCGSSRTQTAISFSPRLPHK